LKPYKVSSSAIVNLLTLAESSKAFLTKTKASSAVTVFSEP